MLFKYVMVPAAIIAASPAHAENFLTLEQAQALMFPGETFEVADITLTDAQVDELIRETGSTVFRNKIRLWHTSGGGWFFLDQVPGRDDRLTYAVAIDRDGVLKSIEILVCVGSYGQVREPEWRNQFKGRRHERGDLRTAISNISGTTLSSAHITDGVKRVLGTYALFVANQPR